MGETEKGVLRIDTFSDGEFSPQFLETIRNKQIFLVCSTSTPEKILKFLLSVDAAKRASASEIVAVIPYYGYGRQDRREGARGAIGAKTLADIMSSTGITRLITADLHAAQIQGFFNIAVDHVSGHKIFSGYLKTLPPGKYTVCSPDAGGVKRAMSVLKRFTELRPDCDINFAMMSKRRLKPNAIESMVLIGDVVGRRVLLVDDMTDTAGTLIKGSDVLMESGAEEVLALITHGVLSGDAIQNVMGSQNLSSLVISDSIEHPKSTIDSVHPKIQVISCAKTFARAISSVANGESMEIMLDKT
jgi:ribose-phosphate pyrophosphokinase